jgi:hypothetical protein
MTGLGALVRKDARLAAGVVLPAACLLVLACTAWVWGAEIRVIADTLRGSGVSVPRFQDRTGDMAFLIGLAAFGVPCFAGMVVVQGDGAHRGAVAAATAPVRDVTKAVTKAAVLLAVVAASAASAEALRATHQWLSGAPSWSPLARTSVLPPTVAITVLPLVSGCIGMASGLVTRRVPQACMLAVIGTALCVLGATVTAWAWYPPGIILGDTASSSDWRAATQQDVQHVIAEMQAYPRVLAIALAGWIGALGAAGGAAVGVIAVLWRRLAARAVGRWSAVPLAALAPAVLAVIVSIPIATTLSGLSQAKERSQRLEDAVRRFSALTNIEIAELLVGARGTEEREWLSEEQLHRLRSQGVLAPMGGREVLDRVAGASGVAAEDLQEEAFRRGFGHAVNTGLRSFRLDASERDWLEIARDPEWSPEQRWRLALMLGKSTAQESFETLCLLAERLIVASDWDEEDLLAGRMLQQMEPGWDSPLTQEEIAALLTEGDGHRMTPMMRVRLAAAHQLERRVANYRKWQSQSARLFPEWITTERLGHLEAAAQVLRRRNQEEVAR